MITETQANNWLALHSTDSSMPCLQQAVGHLAIERWENEGGNPIADPQSLIPLDTLQPLEQQMPAVVPIKTLNFEKPSDGLTGKTGVRRIAAVDASALPSSGKALRRAIQSRTRQVSAGWSPQERATRLRLGSASRTWLLNLIDNSQTT